MNFKVANEGAGYTLSAAVLIYTNVGSGHAFATKHSVDAYAGRPVIRAGSPFTEDNYVALVRALAPAEQPQVRWCDRRLLAQGLGRTIWWNPPQTRSMFFQKSSHNPKTFSGRGQCPSPGLVFMATDKALYVFAFAGKDAPTQGTALYQAPFFNVWSTGQVCVGNAIRPGEDQRESMDAWERMFFGSHFTHPNFSEKDRLTLGVDPTDFWKKQLDTPDTTFPEAVLCPLKLTVADLLAVDSLNKLHARQRANGEF